ncbi:cation diffusion facilitator family transporter [Cellulomonas sp. zg-ZUI222]|uniref:cation diffusion facilitator family transporter n=1 Tax=Cellulomonas TaxID=1707 RepID=UPI001A9519F2|nr:MULTISPECIES: cation diffusion facilitator family transporter [Cellulomonas]MBO0901424.1 cation diffusion facilitator family transporter [Cellulomonas sp. zg-ZUI22]MBO0921870.1 cation diffusion facilitator family transporter [Cellulomonas wangleii]
MGAHEGAADAGRPAAVRGEDGPVRRADSGGESTRTVVLALLANVLVAVTKTVAASITGAASMLAEASHSWADAGNEVFLFVAQRRGARPADASHPFGYGREVYVWSMFAAIGLFAVGAGVSVTHGVHELFDPEPASDFAVAYVVLAAAFVLESTSFLQAWRQSRAEAAERDRGVLEQVLATSDPTVRAVFFEDAAALVGLVIAVAGIAANQVTGSAVPDAVGSILVGLLLAGVAFVLLTRNVRFLVGESVDPHVRDAALRTLLDMPQVARVTQLRLEFVGARRVVLIGAVDLTGDPDETEASRRLAEVEAALRRKPGVMGVVLSLSEPGEPALEPFSRAAGTPGSP